MLSPNQFGGPGMTMKPSGRIAGPAMVKKPTFQKQAPQQTGGLGTVAKGAGNLAKGALKGISAGQRAIGNAGVGAVKGAMKASRVAPAIGAEAVKTAGKAYVGASKAIAKTSLGATANIAKGVAKGVGKAAGAIKNEASKPGYSFNKQMPIQKQFNEKIKNTNPSKPSSPFKKPKGFGLIGGSLR